MTKNFKRHEFSCRCGCGFNQVDYLLIVVLEDVKAFFNGASVRVNSSCRCRKYNKKVGGSKFSKHKPGIFGRTRAADIVVMDHSSEEVQSYLKMRYPNRFGIGCYKTFTHIDVRIIRARW